jgi:hypothetical protein
MRDETDRNWGNFSEGKDKRIAVDKNRLMLNERLLKFVIR